MSKYSRLKVVGSMNGEIDIYDSAEYRRPGFGEVVELQGKYWRIVNPSGCGNEDVTDAWIKAQQTPGAIEKRINAMYSPLNPRPALYAYQRALDAGLIERPPYNPADHPF